MTIVEGKKIAENILTGLVGRLERLPFKPLFFDVVVGSDPVSMSYVNIKARKARELGIDFRIAELPDSITTQELVDELKKIQEQPHLCGLIVQLPLPKSIDKEVVLGAIDGSVDVDNLNHGNFLSPTVASVLEILDYYQVDLANSEVLIVGQGDLVGKPLKENLKDVKKLYTIDETNSSELNSLASHADVVISATGVPQLIRGEIIKDGAVVIDCGTSESAGTIVGDVDTESVSKKAKILSPVPGGVGPITVAKLLTNVVIAAENQK